MNLLYHRLFGDLEMEEAVAAVCEKRAKRRDLSIIRSSAGDVYAGLLAGPGTAWNEVREAMREHAVTEIAKGTIAALDETLGDHLVACVEPALGRREGYPLVLLNPRTDGIEAIAFHAETAGDYIDQGWALLRREFRDGPHDLLGKAPRIVLAGTKDEPFGLLLDGEPAEAGAQMDFVLAKAQVNLLATRDNG